MIFDALLSALLSLLLINAVSARSTAEIYEELVDVLKEIKELETDKEVDEGRRGSITTRDYDDIKKALYDAIDVLDEYNELKRFYYVRGGNLDAFITPVSTANTYAYTLLSSPECAAGGDKSVIFEVKACDNVHVGLKEDKDTDENLYEIVIGGKGSEIRTKKQGESSENVEKKGLVDCKEYRTFMVGWAGGHIQVFRATDSGWEEVIEWQDPKPKIDVNYIGLTTVGFSGHFSAQKRGDDLIIETPKQFNSVVYTMLQDKGFPIVQRPFLVFEVMTCNDAHIALFGSDDKNLTTALQIIIGTDINTKSVIRSGTNDHVTSDLDHVVDCNEYRAFFISWKGGNIQVFRQTGKGWEELMSLSEKGERPIEYVGFTTSLFASGSWRISKTFEKGLDAPAGDTSPETMAGLNNMDTYQTEIEKEEEEAVKSLVATKLLLDRKVFKNLKALQTSDEALRLWPVFSGDKCVKGSLTSVDCSDASDYRTINGECNNEKHPHWGAAGTSQIRLLPAAYDDGVNAPRTKDVNGNNLPSARSLSTAVFFDPSNVDTPDDPIRSLMMMVWGQFIDHDVGETPVSKGYQSVTVQCCNIIDSFIRKGRNQCFPILIDTATDPVYTHDCMNFVRSTAARTHPCIPGIREQINAITSYLDGSMVYGSEHDVADSLRSPDGKLKVDDDNLLPMNDDSACVRDSANAHCFLAGDVRVNENPLLSTMHTAFVRYHNILADRMLAEDSSLEEDDIYYMTRQIIGALIQSITYSRWIPSVLGPTTVGDYGLLLTDSHTYNDTLNGGILLPFTTAALRYGHTLIRDTVDHVDENNTIFASHDLDDVFFVTNPVFYDISSISRGMVTRPSKLPDAHFVPAIDHLLFKNNHPFGFDLGALNIQRGRDHGLPGYVQYLEFCGHPKPTSFSDLPFHNSSFQTILSTAYSHVEDIDLFVGGASEDNLLDGEVGPTFACLLAEQFHRLRYGDRFWYQHDLSDDQIDNVEKVELSKILCEVFDLDEIQTNAFILTDERSKCEDLDDIDVELWKKPPKLQVASQAIGTKVKQPTK
ncbi:myeloperoxidase-like [Mizuhopecten yessoensis]|uniref:myeloperoxidase-like n=1 Tax=Mizuhopecten yessoensis TaxID=6573 RepID=UPI000B458F6D|nr:myeloperoxidase-like [Mizuhopecten yessoensis]